MKQDNLKNNKQEKHEKQENFNELVFKKEEWMKKFTF